MSTVRVDRVSTADRTVPSLEAVHLARPLEGEEWRGVLGVAGWAVGRRTAAVAVEIVREGRVLRSLPIEQRRPDIEAKHPGCPGAHRAGFVGVLSTLGLPAELRLDVRVVLDDSERVHVASIRGRRTPLRLDYQPELHPLLLTTMGRMGSTWMMTLLAAHPQIVVRRGYPYECRAAQYWLRLLKVLSEPGREPGPDGRAGATRSWVASNPFFAWDLAHEPSPGEGLYVDRMAELCQRNIDAWYLAAARTQSKHGVRYFAEKFSRASLPVPLVEELYPKAKEIVLVRDFRDMVCSILAFDRKRGFHGFGRRESEPTEAYVRRLGRFASGLQRHWESRSSRAHLVRYEDLVLRPESVLPDLLRYLELDASPSTVDEALEVARGESEAPRYETHRTSASERGSVGRWRRELDPSLRRLIQEAFDPALEGFGYADSRATAASHAD